MTTKERESIRPDFGPTGRKVAVYLWDTLIGYAAGCTYGDDCRNENITAEYSQFVPTAKLCGIIPRTDELSIDELEGHIWYVDDADGSTRELPMTPVLVHIAMSRYVKESQSSGADAAECGGHNA